MYYTNAGDKRENNERKTNKNIVYWVAGYILLLRPACVAYAILVAIYYK